MINAYSFRVQVQVNLMATAWGRHSFMGGGGLEKGSKEWKRQQRRQAAARALEILANVETSPVMPQQVAVLVSGSLLMCSWRFMSQRLQQFEQCGLSSLAEVWMCMAAAFGLGQLARVMARNSAGDLARSYSMGVPVAGIAGSSSVPYMSEKEGRESGAVAQHQEAEDADDVGVQKRIAQAEAAAKLAKNQQGLRQLLSEIGKTGRPADDAQLLFKLADQLFGSPLNVCELVLQGGVPVILSAARSARQALVGDAARGDVLPALMQLSWVLLQVAHGPPACFAALAEQQDVACTLLDVTNAVVTSSAVNAEAKESTLRNLSWILLVLCDPSRHAPRMQSGSSSSGTGSSSSTDGVAAAAACASALVNAGAVDVLQQLVSLRFGTGPGWVAAAMLGLFVQMGHEQQQQQHASEQQQKPLVPSQELAQTAVSAMLQPDSLHGLAYLLHHQPQLSDRLRGLVFGLLHYLLTFHTSELLQLLVEEHLVGSVASGASPKLGRLLVCQLISVKGQEVMAQIEASYELDVPLALAQIIPLPVHLKLPPAPVPQQQHQQQQQQAGEIQPELAAGPAAAAADPAAPEQGEEQQQQVVDDVYTDVLACRLLLQHNRLDELLAAFKEELCADSADDAAAAASSSQQHAGMPLSPVSDAVLKLVQHLMSRDLELAAVQHERGDSIDESLSSTASSSNSSSVIDAALAMPDASGVYSSVMAGLVPESELPPAGEGSSSLSRSSSSSSSSLLVLPALPDTAPQPCSGCSSSSSSKRSSGCVVFNFGPHHHSVSRCMYKAVKGSSKFIASILRHEKPSAGSPVRLLTTPHFTHAANAWVLRCLERWITVGSLQGFSAAQAAKLWVAADFLQVDALQVACEDVVVAAAAQDGSQLEVALELCARHRASSARLQRLAVRVVLRSLLTPAAAALSAAAAAGGDAGLLAKLAVLMQRHADVMSPWLLAEVRDRLVTLCMLNAGLDDDTPDDDVE